MPEPEASIEAEPGASKAEVAPRPSSPSPARSQRPMVVGVLLLFLAAIGAFQGIFQLAATPDPEDAGFRASEFSFEVSGTVRDAAGGPVANASIFSVQDPATNTTTGPDGSFRLSGLAGGYNAINATAAGHGNVTVRMVLLRNERVDVALGRLGSEAVVEHASLERQRTIARTLGVVVLGLAAVTTAAAISSYQRRRRGLVILGSVTGFFAALPIGVLVAPVAFYMAVRHRGDWA